MTPYRPIFIASITKIYTSVATMILEEQELLSLDDPDSQFLPGTLLESLYRYKGRDYTDPLRIYQLISQTSGLPDYFLERPKRVRCIFDLVIAGSSCYPFRCFVAWDAAGKLVWILLHAGLGYAFNSQWQLISETISK